MKRTVDALRRGEAAPGGGSMTTREWYRPFLLISRSSGQRNNPITGDRRTDALELTSNFAKTVLENFTTRAAIGGIGAKSAVRYVLPPARRT